MTGWTNFCKGAEEERTEVKRTVELSNEVALILKAAPREFIIERYKITSNSSTMRITKYEVVVKTLKHPAIQVCLNDSGRFIRAYDASGTEIKVQSVRSLLQWNVNGLAEGMRIESVEVNVSERTELHRRPVPWLWLVAVSLVVVVACTVYRDFSFLNY